MEGMPHPITTEATSPLVDTNAVTEGVELTQKPLDKSFYEMANAVNTGGVTGEDILKVHADADPFFRDLDDSTVSDDKS